MGDAIRPDRLPYIVTPGLRTFTIRDLLMPGRTSSNAIEYVKETGFQNMAAPVAELAQKPQSDLAFDPVTTPVRTIAHWFHASKQVLDDIPLVQSYIDGRARYGLALAEEAPILAGDRTGQNLIGLIPQATVFDYATYAKASDTKIDRIRRTILQVRVALYRASAVVMNPIDWADIEALKDDNGNYVVGDPAGLSKSGSGAFPWWTAMPSRPASSWLAPSIWRRRFSTGKTPMCRSRPRIATTSSRTLSRSGQKSAWRSLSPGRSCLSSATW
ncbi:phage major capsid protein [Microvirga aerilata]|uniref:Phage major capsid protein n=1 Tax=Microvirga aerilata TaxID=670292 RepID=A0A937D5A3_9HYPH|nr:phage major capsid protein [Microvirga aerilata]